MYSLFTSSRTWQFIDSYPTPRLLLHALLRERHFKTWLVVRNPYARIISCFKDKYRKQPMRIAENNFHWQMCHDVVFERRGVPLSASDEAKAAALLEMTFEDFIQLLPIIYPLDEHFHPQAWLTKLRMGSQRVAKWPVHRVAQMEDVEMLRLIPGIDLSKQTNSTGHIKKDFEWSDETRQIVRDIYRADFALGAYEA